MGLEGLGFVRLQRMDTREGSFQPVNVDAVAVEVRELEQADLGSTKAVAVGDQE